MKITRGPVAKAAGPRVLFAGRSSRLTNAGRRRSNSAGRRRVGSAGGRERMEGAGVGPHWVERATSPQRPDWTGWLGLRRLIELFHPVAHELTASLDPSTQRGPTPAPFEP